MPPTEVVWCILLFTAICYAAGSFLLRASCSLANYTVAPKMQMEIPSYWATLGVLVVASFFMGLLHSVASSAVSFFGVALPEGAVFHFASLLGELLLFAAIVAALLRSEQETPRALALLASLLYVIIFFGTAWCGGRVFLSL